MHSVLRERQLEVHGHVHELLQELTRGWRQEVEEVDHRGGDLEVFRRGPRLLLPPGRHLLLGLQPPSQVLQQFLAERRVEPVAQELEEPLQSHEQRHGEVLVVRQVHQDRPQRRLKEFFGQRLLLNHALQALLGDLHHLRVAGRERLEKHRDYPLAELRQLFLAGRRRLELGVRHGAAHQADARGSQRVRRIRGTRATLERVRIVVLGDDQRLLEQPDGLRVDAHERRRSGGEAKVDDVDNLRLHVDVLGPERPAEQRLRVRGFHVQHLVHVQAAAFAEAHHRGFHHGSNRGGRGGGEELLGEDGDGCFDSGRRVLASDVHVLGRRSLQHAVEHARGGANLLDGVRREGLKRAEQRLQNLRQVGSKRGDWEDAGERVDAGDAADSRLPALLEARVHEPREQLGDERAERGWDRDDERGGGGCLGGIRLLLRLFLLLLVVAILLVVFVPALLLLVVVVVILGALLPALLASLGVALLGFVLLLDAVLLLHLGLVDVHLVKVGVLLGVGLDPLLGVFLARLLLLLLALDSLLRGGDDVLGLFRLLLGDADDRRVAGQGHHAVDEGLHRVERRFHVRLLAALEGVHERVEEEGGVQLAK